MRWLRRDSGFTLIELVLVFAITALLMGGVLVGRGALLQNSSFTSALDNAKNTFRQIQNEANQALSINQLNTGQSAEVVFGRLVQLVPGSSTLKTWTLVGAKDNSGTVAALAQCDEQDTTLQDGVVYDPGASGTESVIFTRNTNSTATGGQVFVAPPIPPALDVPVASPPVSCPTSGSPLPPDQAPPVGITPACPPGETDTRSSGSAVDSCTGLTPAAPTLTVKDAEGSSATSAPPGPYSLTTANTNLTVTVTLPSLPVASGFIHLWDNSTETTINVPINTTTQTYTFSYAISGSGSTAHALEASYIEGLSFESYHSSPDVNVTYTPPSSCSAAGSTSLGYACGLVGSYFRGDQWDTTGQSAQTVAIDGAGAGLNIGPNLGAGQSAYGDFIPALRLRTGQADAQYASVRWTGQIYLAPGSQQICIESDDGASFTINSSSAVNDDPGGTPGGFPPTCGSFDGGAGGAWESITINYHNSWPGGEGGAYVRLSSFVGGSYTTIDGSRLRYQTPVSTYGPPASPQGLTADYWVEQSQNSGIYNFVSSATVNGVGTNATPATSPNWITTLDGITGANLNVQHMMATWFGYLQIPHDGTYQFCTGWDDGSGIYWVNTNTWLAYEDSYSMSPARDYQACGAAVSLTAGQYPVEMFNREETYAYWPANATSFQVSLNDITDNVSYADIPLTWFTTSNTYVAATPPQTHLPGYKQLVDNIEKTAKKIPTTVAQKPPTSLLNAIAKAVTPKAAYAAAGDSPNCDQNILNPYNYLNTCSAFTTNTSILLQVPNDTHLAHMQFDPITGTISWSNN